MTGKADDGELSVRESQVFAFIGAGLLNKQIAHELGIVEKTVAVHVSRILAKLKAPSRLHAALQFHGIDQCAALANARFKALGVANDT